MRNLKSPGVVRVCTRFKILGIMRNVSLLLCGMLTLQGCSVGMAMSGKKDPNLGAFRIGSSRGEVELQLEGPISSVTNGDGTRTDLYE